MTSQPFSQTGKMTDLCCEYLSVRFIWMYVITMSSCQYVIIMPCLLLSYHLYASNRRSRPEVFWIDKFRKIHGKILALQFFLIRLQAAGLQLRDSSTGIFQSILCIKKRLHSTYFWIKYLWALQIKVWHFWKVAKTWTSTPDKIAKFLTLSKMSLYTFFANKM